MRLPGRILLCLIAAAWSHASPPQKQAPVVLQSETRVVLVDAVVTGKKGEYIRDLTAKDFRVWEDNKEQIIQSFTFESAGSGASRTSYEVLVFDYAAMDAGDQIRARQAAAPFIDANAGETNGGADRMMAVATFDGGFRIVQGFTGNAGRLKDALIGAKSAGASVNNATAGTSAAMDLGGRDRFRSLERLALDLAAVPGRKTIVFFTGGLALSNEQKPALEAAIAACNKSNVAVYPIDVREPPLQPAFSADTASGGRGGRGGAAAPNASRILRGDADPSAALDPGGASQQVLIALADRTGGFLIRNAGELPSGLQKIAQEQEGYYVLGYTPPETKEGSCHALRVKVDRTGTTVRARSSYCSGKGQDPLTRTSAEKSLENRAVLPQTGDIAASGQLSFFYVGPNTARVNLAMEISPEAVKFDHKKQTYHSEINVLGIASDSQGDGATGARFTDTITLDFDDAEMQQWKQKPMHYEKEFKIAPGQYTFTVVFSSGAANFGKLEQPLVVEPYQPGQLALSGVAFGREIHKAGSGGAALFEERTGLVAGGMELTPSGSNVFAKTEQVFCYFEVYTPDSASIRAAGTTVTIRILDGTTADVKWDGGPMKLDSLAAGKSVIPVGLNLPVAPLVPGSYRLEVTAADGAEKPAKRSVAFEIK